MIHIVTDGSIDMPAGWEKQYSIHILPLMVRFGEKIYTSGVDIYPDNFYDLVRKYGIVPKTSLPSPGQIADFYRSIASKGEQIISIHLSSKLSGTFSSVQLAAREIEKEYSIQLFDSFAGSAALGFMCRDVRKMIDRKCSMESIVLHLERMRNQFTVLFTLNSLEFARLNGRVSAVQSLVGSLLHIKPIIILRDGLLEIGDKVRTRTASLYHVLNHVKRRLENTPINAAVVHAGDYSTAEFLMDKMNEMMNIQELVMTDLAIPVAANLGPGTVGIVAYPAELKDAV